MRGGNFCRATVNYFTKLHTLFAFKLGITLLAIGTLFAASLTAPENIHLYLLQTFNQRKYIFPPLLSNVVSDIAASNETHCKTMPLSPRIRIGHNLLRVSFNNFFFLSFFPHQQLHTSPLCFYAIRIIHYCAIVTIDTARIQMFFQLEMHVSSMFN
jgi:hypothetical protein